jgi:hypothetical protein
VVVEPDTPVLSVVANNRLHVILIHIIIYISMIEYIYIDMCITYTILH